MRTGFIFFENYVYLKQVSLRVLNSICWSPTKIVRLSLVILQDLSKLENIKIMKIFQVLQLKINKHTGHSRNCYCSAMIMKGCVNLERTLLSRKKSQNLAGSCANSKVFYCDAHTKIRKSI